MKNLALLLLLITMFSCSKEHEHGTIPFNKVNNLPILSMTINDKHVKLLVDTGANSSILHEPLKKKLNFNTHESEVEFTGIGGKQLSKSTSGVVLKYRDSIVKVNFKASDLSHIRKVLNIDGIVGSEYFNKNDIFIDYKNNKIYKNSK